MQLFYNPDLDVSTRQCNLGVEESRHLFKVLRKKEGDEILITNGKGDLFTAVIRRINMKICTVDLQGSRKEAKQPHTLHMAVSPTKLIDRYEWFLEKVTEIGVAEITPVLCERSERKVIKAERLEKIILAAMKQSLRSYLPVLHPLMTLDEFLNRDRQGLRYIAHCEPGEKSKLTPGVAPDTEITILIGPEGDFTTAEILRAREAGFAPITLGEARLRTETAAVVACTAINLYNGN